MPATNWTYLLTVSHRFASAAIEASSASAIATTVPQVGLVRL
jgi:hypothetical protein